MIRGLNSDGLNGTPQFIESSKHRFGQKKHILNVSKLSTSLLKLIQTTKVGVSTA